MQLRCWIRSISFPTCPLPSPWDGLEDGNLHTRENLPFIIAGSGGGSLKTGRFLENIEGNQGDLLTTLLACLGVPLDGPLGIGTKQIKEMMSA